ncbi:MAG TPA: reverse transcriptase family protein, partial [Methylomicrobium sp.]|nr:reverse transcriptase family protein [Methylomicrobium sp.]
MSLRSATCSCSEGLFLAPFLVQVFNQSLALGVVPDAFKAAYITPLLKKSDADPADAKSYRPISNLSILSKLLERLVARQLLDFLTMARLLPDLQSAYRAYHSTETAVLKVLSDILLAVDSGDIAILTLLDLSAAFDTVDHQILLRRLEVSYGLGGSVHDWLTSYLHDRTQFVRCGSSSSTPTRVRYGVPQGSVLGPILFLLYTADLIGLVESHSLCPHLYADDTQVSGHCRPDAAAQLQDRVSVCIADVARWMRSNRLQLNTAKTEVIWCASARRQHQIPTVPLVVEADNVVPVMTVRDLGIHIDSDLSMRTHISKTVASCFAVLRQIRSIRRSVTRPVLQSLVVSLVLTKLDYGCATLAGLPAVQLNRLQSVLNAAAKLIYFARKYDHVTPLLQELHWLRVQERITFCLATLAYRCQHGIAPSYLAAQLHRLSDVESRQRLRSAATVDLQVHQTLNYRQPVIRRGCCA